MNNHISNSLFNKEPEEELSNASEDTAFAELIKSVDLDEEIQHQEANPFDEPMEEFIPYNASVEPRRYSYDLSENFLDGMNPEQKEAVLYDEGSLLVLAGAGSGKTRVITHRFAHLVQKYGLGIHNILCVTFTNKAAAEMKERINSLLGTSVKGAWIRTFHSMCAMILREHSVRIGYSQEFTIYDASDARNTIKKIMERLNINPKDHPDKAIARVISSSKEELISPEELEKSARSEFDQICAEVYKEYQLTLKHNQAMDFGDLISNTILVLEQCPDILERYQRQWRFIMADEFQDTNKPQYHLLSLLSRDKSNVCVVGDDDQSIYAWRGARVENIRQFQQEFNAHVIRLERNYRSCGNILEAANSVVKSIKGRMRKTLKPQRENGEKIVLTALGDDRLQAAFIYEEMNKLIDKGAQYKEFAVLYRTNAQSRVIEEVFTRHRIPHKIYGGQRFFDRAEIKDILSYLRVIINPYDREAFDRIVNVPKRKIGDVGKRKIQEFVEARQISYQDVCLQAAQIDGITRIPLSHLENLGKILYELKEAVNTTLPTQIIKILVESIRYFEDYLVPEYGNHEAENRFDNIQELVNAVKVFEQANPGASIADFLREASLLSSLNEEDVDSENMVSLMTIHSAKGLEFPIVFVIGITEGMLPLSSSRTQEEMDEEKRLFYVAVTRAMNKLYLTYERRSLRYGEFISNEKSHFLDAIPQDVIEEREEETSTENFGFQKDKFRQQKNYSHQNKYPQRSNQAYSNKGTPSKYESLNDILESPSKDCKTEKIEALSEISIGQEVIHGIFGRGTVEYVSDVMVRVAFDRFGTQILMGNTLSNLTKIIS